MSLSTNGISRALFSVVELIVLFGVVMVTVALVQATRRIPVQYAKQVVGGKVYGGQRQFIPLKVNACRCNADHLCSSIDDLTNIDWSNLGRYQ